MSSILSPKFVVLAILDGWGIAPESPGNAITKARTRHMERVRGSFPHTRLRASGEAVGLPKGEDGNTETGHLNLGAGKIVYQDLERINRSISDGRFKENETLLKAIAHANNNNTNLHLLGLIGSGGVHSNVEHLYSLIKLAAEYKVKNLYIHAFTDGRDSPPTIGVEYVEKIQKILQENKTGKIASIMGRYWSMDRDQRWNRTEKAYNALTKGTGIKANLPIKAMRDSYDKGITDEFVEPTNILDENGNPVALISNGDSAIFFNFRIDRPRQLTKAFVFDDFSQAAESVYTRQFLSTFEKQVMREQESKTKGPFDRGKKIEDLLFVTMTDYGKATTNAGALPAFPPELIAMPLSGAVSVKGKRQLKITESEKERFVTYYFNGLRDKPYPYEDTIIIPSPMISTYDLQPEMSSKLLTDTLVKKIKEESYRFILVNFPNADMVAHTGNIGPAVKAVEAVDSCIGILADLILNTDGMLIITADHGNAEEMINERTGEIDTEHSVNPVPFIAVSRKLLGKPRVLLSGKLADVAPTILNLLRINVPLSMTGRDLLKELRD